MVISFKAEGLAMNDEVVARFDAEVPLGVVLVDGGLKVLWWSGPCLAREEIEARELIISLGGGIRESPRHLFSNFLFKLLDMRLDVEGLMDPIQIKRITTFVL